MNNNVSDFDGLKFLDELENVAKVNGMNGIIQLCETVFEIGSLIQMDHGSSVIYRIDRVVVKTLNPEKIILDKGDSKSNTVIRSMNLPYLKFPFQIDIYGSIENDVNFR